jgi:N-acetylneuraminic acid mutarotase
MPTARGNLAIGVINGILYAVGGTNGNGFPLNTVEAYDLATNTWAAKADMPTPRTYLAAGVINGMLYAVGGWGDAFGQTTLNTVEAYDPATDIWATEAPMPTRRYLLAGAVTGRKFYAVGGWNANKVVNAVEVFDPR